MSVEYDYNESKTIRPTQIGLWSFGLSICGWGFGFLDFGLGTSFGDE